MKSEDQAKSVAVKAADGSVVQVYRTSRSFFSPVVRINAPGGQLVLSVDQAEALIEALRAATRA